MSWNTNGLHLSSASGSRRGFLRRELEAIDDVDIRLVQEHKLSQSQIDRYGKLLRSNSYTYPATPAS